ncbi:MAG: MASE1 domain-containing protein [Phycisphaerales bacterium]|nr:MASE1 domain-containing protein [Phycisphaerales bacterium]
MDKNAPKILVNPVNAYQTQSLFAWFAVIFLIAELLGNSFGYGVDSISILWPPTGILGAALAITHKKHWFALIFIAAVLDFSAGLASNNFKTDSDFIIYLIIGLLTNPITALTFAITFRKLIPNARPLSAPKLFGLYVLIPITLNTALTSFLAMSLLYAYIPDFPFQAAWQQWWYSDVTGLLTFATPFIMIASSWKTIVNLEDRTVEAFVVLFVFLIVSAVLFSDLIPIGIFKHYELVLMLPIYAWIVARFGAVVMSMSTLILTIVVLAALVNHTSPFESAGRSAASNVIAVQGFLVPVTLCVLFIAALLESRKDQFDRILDHERQLRKLSRIESLGTMAGGVAHDFGNLTIAMRAYHSVLRQQIKDPNKAVIDAIHGLDEAADGAQTLTKSLMILARDEQVDHQPIFDTIDLCATTQEAIKMIQPLLTPILTLDIQIPDEPIYIAARSTDIQRLISNICLNSKDATDQSGTLQVIIREHPAGIWLLITDDGCGMDAETQERAFDPFFTTKTRGRGTGLGLAVVAGIIRDIGATINLASNPNQGTTVAIDFPIAGPPSEVVDPD